jgi:WD40 repeat protein
MQDPTPDDDSQAKFDAMIAAAKQRAFQPESDHRSSNGERDLQFSDSAAMPDRIGPFEIKRLIARGGSSWVFEAFQEQPPRRVAIKVLRDMVSQEAKDRFEYEARLLATLEHPNIVRIYAVGQWKAEGVVRPYIAMEYIGQQTLQRYASEQRLRYRERLRLLIATCAGMQYAHQRGIIHRDLKPTNVVVDDQGRPQVVDFGVAKALAGDTSMHTKTGQWLGTPSYMSPEQLTESPTQVDTRTDVYGLGTIGYELLSGRPPFSQEGRPLAQFIREIVETAPKPLGQFDSSFRGDIETVIATALHKRPSDRYQSVAAFASDLQNCLDSRPIAARRIHLAGRLMRWSRRQPAAAASMLLAVVMAILLVVTGLVVFRQTQAMAESRRLQLYAFHLNLATQAFNEHDIDTARRRLQQGIPDPGESDLRGFAWYHLWHRLHQQEGEIKTHLTDVYDIQFTSDRTRVIACGDGGWCVWDTSNWKLLQQHQAGQATYSAVRILSDDDSFVTACFNRFIDTEQRYKANRIQRWDLETGELLNQSEPFQHPVQAIALSNNGKRLFLGGGALDRYSTQAYAGELNVLAAKNLQPIKTPITRSASKLKNGQWESEITAIGSIVVLPDARIATAHKNAPARVWDLQSGESRTIAVEIASQSTALDLSPDKRLLAIGNWNNEVALWHTLEEQVVRTIPQARPHRIRFHPHKDQIAITSNTPDNAIHLWHTKTGEKVGELIGHSSDAWCLAFDPNGTRLISGLEDFSLFVWNLNKTNLPKRYAHVGGEVPSLDVSENQRWLAYGSRDGTATVCEIAGEDPVLQVRRPNSHVWGVAFHPANHHVAFGFADLPATGQDEHPIRLFDFLKGDEIREVPQVHGACADLVFSSDGRFLAASYRYKNDPEQPKLQVWNTTTWQSWEALRGEPLAVNAVAFSPDSSRVATCGDDRQVRVWDASSGQLRITSPPLPAPAVSITYSPHGNQLAVGTWARDQFAVAETEVRLLDAETLATRQILLGHRGGAYGLAFTHDGSILATGAAGGGVKLWDLRTAIELATLRTPSTGWVFDLEFTPDDRSLFATYGSLTDQCGVIRFDAASTSEVNAHQEARRLRRVTDAP